VNYHNNVIQFVKLKPVWQARLLKFGEALKLHRDDYYFAPHLFSDDALSKLACNPGKDLYYLMVNDDNIIGYGLLRGWDEGYAIPSLGIAIHPSAQNKGYGKYFMNFLHDMAYQKGAVKVRLRVRKDNENAIRLYRNFNYLFEEDPYHIEYLIGFKTLL